MTTLAPYRFENPVLIKNAQGHFVFSPYWQKELQGNQQALGVVQATIDSIWPLIAKIHGSTAEADSPFPFTPQQRSWSEFDAIRDTQANRANYPAGAYSGDFYIETDANSDVVYQSTGSAWVYVCGIARGVLADIPTGLGTNDSGLLYEVTDYNHVLSGS